MSEEDDLIAPYLPIMRDLFMRGTVRRYDHNAIWHDFNPCDDSCPAEERERLVAAANADVEAVRPRLEALENNARQDRAPGGA